MQRPRPPSQGLPKVAGSQLGQDPLVQRSQEDFQLLGPTWANFSLIRRKCLNIIFLNYHMPPEIRSVEDHQFKNLPNHWREDRLKMIYGFKIS